jgi:hypothetical protein
MNLAASIVVLGHDQAPSSGERSGDEADVGQLPVERNSLAPVARAMSAVRTPRVVVFQLFILFVLLLFFSQVMVDRK